MPESRPEPPGSPDLTRLLQESSRGDARAASDLLPLVYEQLRRIAGERMRGERTDHTLQATALVHEAYARLVGNDEVAWDGRGHFYTAAAEAMRRILIEHARSRGRSKRGGDGQRVPLALANVASLAESDFEQIAALDAAFRRLEESEPRLAHVVRLRFYAGLTAEETARATGMSVRTVHSDWAFARAWLFRALNEGD